MPEAIVARGLSKRFPQGAPLRRALADAWRRRPGPTVTAVDRVDLDVASGELFGLLGPNGAGKTTLVKLLCTLVLPDGGSARVNGFPLEDETRVKASVGFVSGDERSFYWRLTGRQNLEFFGALQGLPKSVLAARIRALSEWLGLDEFLDRRFDGYSSGMKQRLGIARGLLHEPRVLFLDEPTRSLDPTAATHLRETIRRLVQREGYTVVLVTHRLHEAETICDRMAIMHRGRIRVASDLASLRRMLGPDREYRIAVAGLAGGAVEHLGRPEGACAVELRPLGDGRADIVLRSPAGGPCLGDVLERVVRAGGRILDVESRPTSLDEIFHRCLEQTDDPSL